MLNAVFNSGNEDMFSLFATDSSCCPYILGLFDSVNNVGYKRIKPHLFQHLGISSLRPEIRKLIGNIVEEPQSRPTSGLNDKLLKR
jgi:hypothetical protein